MQKVRTLEELKREQQRQLPEAHRVTKAMDEDPHRQRIKGPRGMQNQVAVIGLEAMLNPTASD